MGKVRKTVSIDPELAAWVEERIRDRFFKDFTHAVNFCLDFTKRAFESIEFVPWGEAIRGAQGGGSRPSRGGSP